MEVEQSQEMGTMASAMTRRSVLTDDARGFLAGAFSGATKCLVGHPFDTIKVRMQTSTDSQFQGSLDCLRKTIQNEGALALYKGVVPPLIGWLAMDSILLGSYTLYRRWLREKVPFNKTLHRLEGGAVSLKPLSHGITGAMAGCTVCVVATPVEHIKARLQVQYAALKADRLYSGPVDCAGKIFRAHGVRGLYHGFSSTLIFRSNFAFFWAGYDIFTRSLHRHTSLSTPAINFWAGGMAAQVFWATAYPADVVKQRMMTDALGGGFDHGTPRYPRWIDAVRGVYAEQGIRSFWRGCIPCFLRAFPANACALLAFETVLRNLKTKG